MHKALLLTLCGIALAGCEQLGIEDPAKVAAAKEAEGHAIGSACRHSGRALEDCYLLNAKASKAAIFTGWRDMDAYMRENSIESVTPTSPKLPPTKPAVRTEPPAEESKAEATEEGKTPVKEAKPEAKKSSAADTPRLPLPAGRGKMA
jgi:predicted flap endonuclease-1-like 5' DNA nuclease